MQSWGCQVGPCGWIFQPPIYCFSSLPLKGMSHHSWRNMAMNPQLNTFQISQGSPSTPTTHAQARRARCSPRGAPLALEHPAGALGMAKGGREGVGRLWELHIWQWSCSGASAQAVCSSSAGAGTARGEQEEQGKELFQAAAKWTVQLHSLCCLLWFLGAEANPVVSSPFRGDITVLKVNHCLLSLCNAPADATRGALSRKRGQKNEKTGKWEWMWMWVKG